jgi:hypothetical protein
MGLGDLVVGTVDQLVEVALKVGMDPAYRAQLSAVFVCVCVCLCVSVCVCMLTVYMCVSVGVHSFLSFVPLGFHAYLDGLL